EVLLEGCWVQPDGLSGVERDLEVLAEVGAEVHQDDVSGLEWSALSAQDTVVHGGAPHDHGPDAAAACDAGYRRCQRAVWRTKEPGPDAEDGGVVVERPADLSLLGAGCEAAQVWVRDGVVLDRRAEVVDGLEVLRVLVHVDGRRKDRDRDLLVAEIVDDG